VEEISSSSFSENFPQAMLSLNYRSKFLNVSSLLKIAVGATHNYDLAYKINRKEV